jgi:uncharacterized MAPEG superfamily protein
MAIAFWCIFIAGLLPIVAVAIAKFDKGYDNNNPRDWLATREGRSRRAHAAHLNSYEAFPLFAIGVLVAVWLKAPQTIIDTLAVTFVVARIIYIWCYVTDRATMRSLVWMVGLGASIGLYFVAAFSR